TAPQGDDGVAEGRRQLVDRVSEDVARPYRAARLDAAAHDARTLRPREASVEGRASRAAARDRRDLALGAELVERRGVRAEDWNDGVGDPIGHLVEIQAQPEAPRGVRERGRLATFPLPLRLAPRVAH